MPAAVSDRKADLGSEPPPGASEVLRVWPDGAPDADGAASPELITVAPDGCRWIRNVAIPTLTLFRPDGEANGTAVVVAPGGGFRFVSIDNEGYDVARWLTARGFVAAVLKYRVVETPEDDEAFLSALRSSVERHAADQPSLTARMSADSPKAVADVEQSVRLVRALGSAAGAATVGVAGFSAGGTAALGAALSADADGRPDFVASIYGVAAVPERLTDLPPLFLAVSADDRLAARPTLELHRALRAARQSVELHVYEDGGHGYGARPQGKGSDHWIDAFGWWLEAQGSRQPQAAR